MVEIFDAAPPRGVGTSSLLNIDWPGVCFGQYCNLSQNRNVPVVSINIAVVWLSRDLCEVLIPSHAPTCSIPNPGRYIYESW